MFARSGRTARDRRSGPSPDRPSPGVMLAVRPSQLSERGERERQDLGANRAQPRAVGRTAPPLLPALVGRRAERRGPGPLLGPVPPRGRGDRDDEHRCRRRAPRASRAAPSRGRGARPSAPLGRLRRGLRRGRRGRPDDRDPRVRAGVDRGRRGARDAGAPVRDRERPAADLTHQARGPDRALRVRGRRGHRLLPGPLEPRRRARRRGPRADQRGGERGRRGRPRQQRRSRPSARTGACSTASRLRRHESPRLEGAPTRESPPGPFATS